MYGMEWLIVLGVLGLALGIGGGYLLAGRSGRAASRTRELETQLEASRQELADYRAEVVNQFRETAEKFQTLNESYTDLHQHLARSSRALCGDAAAGPLLAAPAAASVLLEGTPERGGDDPVDPYDDLAMEDPAVAAAATAEAETVTEESLRAADTADTADTEDMAATDDLTATAEAEAETPADTVAEDEASIRVAEPAADDEAAQDPSRRSAG